MWEFPGGRDGGSQYLVLGLADGSGAQPDPPADAELIAFGPLLSDSGTAWLGTAALVCAPDPDAARAVLVAQHYVEIEVHRWEFGGRR